MSPTLGGDLSLVARVEWDSRDLGWIRECCEESRAEGTSKDPTQWRDIRERVDEI